MQSRIKQLAKMEEALQQQLLGIKNFNSDIPIVGRGREAAGGARRK